MEESPNVLLVILAIGLTYGAANIAVSLISQAIKKARYKRKYGVKLEGTFDESIGKEASRTATQFGFVGSRTEAAYRLQNAIDTAENPFEFDDDNYPEQKVHEPSKEDKE